MSQSPPISPPAAPPTAPADPLLRQFLRGRDAPCPVCGYSLRDLQAGACPECGTHLHLQVGSDQVRLGPWIAAILSPTLAAGFDGVVTVLMTTALILEPPRTPAERAMAFGVAGSFAALAIACGIFIATLIGRRRGWVRLSRRSQWRSAAIIFLVIFFVHATFGALLLFWL